MTRPSDVPGASSRREFLVWGAALTLGGCAAGRGAPALVRPARGAAAGPLDDLDLVGVAEAMGRGELTAVAATRHYLERIERLDRQGPAVRAVIEVNPDALAEAERLDEERAAGTVRGPLHGVPVLLKDNIATADRTGTTAGSLALEGVRSPGQSGVAARLAAAGALLLGKANMSEWANFRSTRSASGWSARGGLTRNPHALDRSPSGSSSGSAVAVAAGMAAAAIGTETNGSIVSPASLCGVVGLKPTVGLVSRSLVVPISHTQDTAGPMTRSVRDAALLLGVLAGVDPNDPATAIAEGAPADYTRFLDADGLRGARIGVARRLFGFDPHADGLAEEALAVLRDRGAVLVDPVDTPASGDFGTESLEVLLFEFKAGLNAYLARLGADAKVRTLAELIAFNREHAAREMPYFGQELFEMAQERGDLSDATYREALAKVRQLAIADGIDRAVAAHRLDALVAPTNTPAWVADLVNGDHYIGGCSTLPAIAGAPHITVPAGAVFGLPVGLSFFGKALSESTLLRLAYAFEQATQHRRAPTFAAHAALGG